MAGIASKNVFDVLGNDPEQDSDAEPQAPTRAIEKTLPRTKRAPDAAPTGPRGAAGERGERGGRGGGRRGGFGGGDDADPARRFQPKDDGLRQDRHPERVRGGHQNWSAESRGARGSRGGRGGRGVRDDRHSRTGRTDTEKEISQGWGSPRGEAEWQDEKAGEAIAQQEEKEGGYDASPAAPVDADGKHPETTADWGAPAATEENQPEPEPEDNTRSYADYLAEQAEKRLHLAAPEPRKIKENKTPDEKWGQAKELKRPEGEQAFIAGSGGKAKRDRQRKEKTYLDIETRPIEPPRDGREGGRGGRGRGRGEGRGEFRGRGRGNSRGGGGGGGGGFRGRGGRGGGGGGDGGASVDVADPTAFPSLGGAS
ncbi:MAG: hypothetical protein M1823_000614 [Watsoniomyces obsoletus]|nr:MAG: hypothetical protein M1823_000614 [Watsoniomyces obsoletus]